MRTLGTLAAAGAVGAAAALSSAGALGALNASTTTVREITAPVTTGEPEAAVFARANAPLSIHDIYVRNAPGVVQVTATTQRALGSGFVLDKAGHIVTNYRVVHGASRVEVSFSDQERLPARIVGRDPSTDLAVLQVRVSSRALTPLRLGNSDLVRVGDSVVAIGNPLGEDRSITSGIVSAIERRIYAPNGAPIDHGIRTDTALDHGSSGGPLLNARGQVIGVTSQIQTGGDGNIGIGFAIPVDTVESVVAQLIANGKVFHPFVGVQARAITPGVSALFRLPARSGLLVSRVCADTGAATVARREAAGDRRGRHVAARRRHHRRGRRRARRLRRHAAAGRRAEEAGRHREADRAARRQAFGLEREDRAGAADDAVLIAPPHGPAPLGAGSRIGRRPARPTGA